MLFAIDLDEYFIHIESVAVTAMFAFQSSGVKNPELYASESDGFPAHGNAALSQDIFDITVAQVESVVQPDKVGNDVRCKSMAFVCVHSQILAISGTRLVITPRRASGVGGWGCFIALISPCRNAAIFSSNIACLYRDLCDTHLSFF